MSRHRDSRSSPSPPPPPPPPSVLGNKRIISHPDITMHVKCDCASFSLAPPLHHFSFNQPIPSLINQSQTPCHHPSAVHPCGWVWAFLGATNRSSYCRCSIAIALQYILTGGRGLFARGTTEWSGQSVTRSKRKGMEKSRQQEKKQELLPTDCHSTCPIRNRPFQLVGSPAIADTS